MPRSISRQQMMGLIFTVILGTILHFLFDWTGGSRAAALVSAVNESIWEHMKLVFVPMVVFALYQRRNDPAEGFWRVKLAGIITALALIPVLYYTYTGALGLNADWFNITIFFIAAGAAFWLETKLFQSGRECRLPDRVAAGIIFLLAGAFLLFTFAPPKIPLFQDPLDGSFGFQSPG